MPPEYSTDNPGCGSCTVIILLMAAGFVAGLFIGPMFL